MKSEITALAVCAGHIRQIDRDAIHAAAAARDAENTIAALREECRVLQAKLKAARLWESVRRISSPL